MLSLIAYNDLQYAVKADTELHGQYAEPEHVIFAV